MSANTLEVEVEVVNNDESVMMNTRQLINNDKRQAKLKSRGEFKKDLNAEKKKVSRKFDEMLH